MAEKSDKRTPGLDDPESIASMRHRHVRLGMRMQALGALALEQLEKKAKAGEPLNLSAEDAKTLHDGGLKLESEALGEKEPKDDNAPIPKKPIN
jgi:hypothetical protein